MRRLTGQPATRVVPNAATRLLTGDLSPISLFSSLPFKPAHRKRVDGAVVRSIL
jgi:hypothetical protein